MDHRMQIMQECRDYDLTTNSVKLVQQTTLSEDDSSACSWYPLQSTYLINWLKFKKKRWKCPSLDYKHNLAHVCAIHWYELHQWLCAAAHVTRQSSTASVHGHHGSSDALFSRFYSHRIQTWAITTASFLARWILRFHMLYATEIGSSCDFWVSQGSAETYLRWGGESLWRACTEFPRESDSERIL